MRHIHLFRRGDGRRRTGFSVVELGATVTILLVLVGVVSFRSDAVEKDKVARILTLIEELRIACSAHHADTGAFAREYTNYEASERKLSAEQATAGWAGPYIAAPLSHKTSNPFGNLHLYDNPRANNWIPGFDIDGNGTVDVDAHANMLWLSGIDQETAQVLDDSLDQGLSGKWSDSGRVRYDPGSRYCYVLVHHGSSFGG